MLISGFPGLIENDVVKHDEYDSANCDTCDVEIDREDEGDSIHWDDDKVMSVYTHENSDRNDGESSTGESDCMDNSGYGNENSDKSGVADDSDRSEETSSNISDRKNLQRKIDSTNVNAENIENYLRLVIDSNLVMYTPFYVVDFSNCQICLNLLQKIF